MDSKQVVFSSGRHFYILSIKWTRTLCQSIDILLLLLNNHDDKATTMLFLDVFTRQDLIPLSLCTTLSKNSTVQVYGLQSLRSSAGGYYGVRTSGSTNISDVQTDLELTSDVEQSICPVFKEKDNFQIDIIHHPSMSYSLSTAPVIQAFKEYLVVFLEEIPWQHMTEYKKYVMLYTKGHIFDIPCPIAAAVDYKIFAKKATKLHCGWSLDVTSHAHVSMRSYMTKEELKELFFKAAKHVLQNGSRFVWLSHFYRTKDEKYFKFIHTHLNGVMKKYIKNLGGDQASTLNRKIEGLFFSADVDPVTFDLPTVSPYGNLRVHIPVSAMVNENYNLYFADFYCHYINHRITLVVTRRNSDTDIFCQQRLLKLNPTWNPFMTMPYGNAFACVTTGAKVELFYTEDININLLMWTFPGRIFYKHVVCMNRGQELKTIIGPAKNDNCTICNLDKRHTTTFRK